MSSETASFTDPQFLATYGLSRINALEYFLHPLNPFRTKNQTCNEILAMQGISIAMLMHGIMGQQSHSGGVGGPLSLERAEEEYYAALSRLEGEQYELVDHTDTGKDSKRQQNNVEQSPLFTIRHVLRTKSKATTLGIYYILEGIIYKSPSARALMKFNVARTCQGLIDVCNSLSECVHYTPTSGYFWDFDSKLPGNKSLSSNDNSRKRKLSTDDNQEDEIEIFKQFRKMKRESSVVQKKRRPEDRTDEEEEETRAKDRINAILIRMSKSSIVKS